MTTLMDKVRDLEPDQLAALQRNWPNHLDPPGHLTDPDQIKQGLSLVDEVIEGIDVPQTLEEARGSAGLMLKTAGLVDRDEDWSSAAILYAVGRELPPDHLDVEQLTAVWRVARDVHRGRLVLRFDDHDRPYLVTAGAHRLDLVAIDLARSLGKSIHPDDTRIGTWRVVAVTISPTGAATTRTLIGETAAAHQRWLDSNHPTSTGE